MQRNTILFAYFFVCVNCFSQQYPFVHYTPKDGLISNQIRNIYQDSKGRLYFISVNGLSVYDGSSFINYNSRNGLNYDIVNCVMEMGDDSVWIVTNSSKINCLVKGKMKFVSLKDTVVPIINNLVRDNKGVLYAATDQGLYYFENGHFIRLPFIDQAGKNINFYISYLFPFGHYLLLQRDNSIIPEGKHIMYLYDTETKEITSELKKIYCLHIAPDRRIWVSTENKIMSVDTLALQQGRIVLNDLPSKFDKIKNFGGYYILFDREGNCWLGDQSTVLIKAATDGMITTFNSSSGLSMFYMNSVFMDREGITWIATNNGGINKLVNSNFSLIENPFNIPAPYDISYTEYKNQLLVYSGKKATAVSAGDNGYDLFKVKNADEIERIVETPYGFFGIRRNAVCKMSLKNKVLYPEIMLTDSTDNLYSGTLIDKNGNLIVCGKYHLSAIVNGKTICRKKLNFFADYAALDNKGNIWVVTRNSNLIMFQPNPGDPSDYLVQKRFYSKELSGFSARSIIIDKNEDIWIGTRDHGIYVFNLDNGILTKKFNLTKASGLSDNFTTYLACDSSNNIWASSALGLDRISIKDGIPVIENLTKQNNIYQSVFKVVIDKNNTAWGAVSNGLIRIASEKKQPVNYTPTLLISMIKSGKDTITGKTNTSLTYKQNNLSFYFAATSFLDERQVMYSYRLRKGSNNPWSEPSNNTSVSFIDLLPGEYTLDIKAAFPAGRYAEQIISYKFSIESPWWQTWWFRSIAGILIIGFLIIVFRFYYSRKLDKQLAVLEKKQAIEKERTRIATDMHDDLGAGLSRIKFLSETIGMKKQQQQPIEEDINKIREFSHEMIDKMGEIVWALNEKNDSLSDLLSYTRAYSVEYLSQSGIKCEVETPDDFPSLFVSGEFRRNIFLSLKEALHNIVKHSQANYVTIRIHINHQLTIIIQDDGIGFNRDNIRPFSNGLTNMEKRMNEVGGTISIKNEKGTTVQLSAPLPA